jgi:hypothetical protein
MHRGCCRYWRLEPRLFEKGKFFLKTPYFHPYENTITVQTGTIKKSIFALT